MTLPPPAWATANAIPKSATVGSPRSLRRMFPGLMSRWDDSVLMGVVEGRGHLLSNCERLFNGELLLAVDFVPKGVALDVRCDEEEETVGFARVVEGQDTRMGELRGRFDLGQEPLGTDNCGEFRFENLEGHVAVVTLIVGQIYRSHPALADLALDPVAAFKGGVQAGDGVGHGFSPSLLSSKASPAGLRPELVPSVEVVKVFPTVDNPALLELEDDAAANVQVLAIPLRAVVMNADHPAVITPEQV